MIRATSSRLRVPLTPLAFAVLLAGALAGQEGPPPDTVRVMTFNLWHGGEAGGQPLEQSVRVIAAARADIVGLQETHARERDDTRADEGARLAVLLDWHYLDQGRHRGILSRWPIAHALPGRSGAVVRLPSGRALHVFNVHLAHAPYQPYQLLGIPYEDAPFLQTAEQAVDAARQARGAELDEVLVEIRASLARGEVVVLTGDFNEPSHRDWTPRAVDAGLAPLAVPYPSTRAVEEAGLRDAFRTVQPDEVIRPGWTWTPTTDPTDPEDRHDRIDLVFVGGARASIHGCEIVGERTESADIVVDPWPSDHRAVVATIVVR